MCGKEAWAAGGLLMTTLLVASLLSTLRSALRDGRHPSPFLANYTRYRDIDPSLYTHCPNCSFSVYKPNSEFSHFEGLVLNSDEMISEESPPLLCRPDTFGYSESDAAKLFPYTGFRECGWDRKDRRQFLHLDTESGFLWMNCSSSQLHPSSPADFKGKYSLDLGSDHEYLGIRDYSQPFHAYTGITKLLHNEEFAYATCDHTKEESLENAVYRNRKNDTVAGRAERLGMGGRPVFILVLTLDSVSRRNFYRKMPQTVEFLTGLNESFRVFDFKLSNVMGEYSADNIMPMLYGDIPVKMMKDIPEEDVFYNRSVYKLAKEHGFVTTFIEDNCGDDLARYLGKNINVDHIGSYFWCAAVKYDNYINNAPRQRCIGQLNSHMHVYGYILDAQRNYKGLSQFAFLHINTAHESSGRLIETLDSDTASFLSSLLSDPSTEYALFLNGDHGMRYGDWFKKLDGSKEHRLPLLHLVVSDSLLARIPHSYDVVTHNSNRLVSKLDLHTTLRHIIKQTQADITTHKDPLYAGRVTIGL